MTLRRMASVYEFPDRLIVIAALIAAACATSRSPRSDSFVPSAAGIVARTDACRVTGAWTLDGASAPPPTVTRCVLPRYPESRRSAGQQGEIVFRIMVDSAGIPDSASLRVVRTSMAVPTLLAPVRAAAPYLRFAADSARPMIIVQLPFIFTLGK